LLARLIRSKGLHNLVRRGSVLLRRYGFTSSKMESALQAFVDLLERHKAKGSFPITTRALLRNPQVARRLLERAPWLELGVHGDRHVDLTELSQPEISIEIQRAMTGFREHGIPFAGFRAPYLRWNDQLLDLLGEAGFWYDSSSSILWPVLPDEGLSAVQVDSLRLLCEYCQPCSTETHLALPWWVDGLLQIPVSFPDDEMLVERLQIRDARRLADIWSDVLDQCHSLHELFVLQLHPERFPCCAEALDQLLQHAQGLKPAVWMANLTEIAIWWKSRQGFRLDALPAGEGVWEVSATAPEDAVLLVRNAGIEGESQPWSGEYRVVRDRHFRIRCDRHPSISLDSSAPLNMVRFLSDEGYLLEVAEKPAEDALLISATSFCQADARSLLERIEGASTPLVRWSRWPDGCGSALCVSGDVDSLTLWDYLWRPFEK